jgi:purine nucleosidase/pyrimidine-specific ribonucleoside hydrolase
MPKRVIIDTDPGIDDALALLLALQSPELDIAAITTVSGNVSVETATRNVFTIFSLLPSVVRPPVAKGAAKPRQKAPVFATDIHGDDGLGRLDRYRDATGKPRYAIPAVTLSPREAAEEILYQLSTTPHPLPVIALGPLTNIAAAIEKDRKTMVKAQQIVLMGGAITVPGNVTPAAEFNIYVDPHAAHIVFTSGIPLTVVGLDVTRQVKLTKNLIETTVAPANTVVSQFLCDCTAELLAFAEAREGEPGLSLHDPLAVGVTIDPSFVSTEALPVEIETEGRVTEGMTVADRRPVKPARKKPANAEVCLGVDAPRFLSFFLERVLCLT